MTPSPGMDGQGGQDDAVPPAQGIGTAVDAHWAENGDTHVSTVALPRRAVNSRDTEAIPGNAVPIPARC